MTSNSNFDRTQVRTLVPEMPAWNEVVPYLKEIDANRWYSNFGPLSSELTERIAAHLGVSLQNICLIGNATLGIQAVCELTNSAASNPVELPSFTFAASAMAVHSSGRRYKFVDIDEEMRCIPSSHARTVIDVLPFGDGVREENWMHNLDFLIIDAAASFDALENFGKTFTNEIRWALVLSLHATKLVGAGEGGVVVSNDVQLIESVKLWQNFGFDLRANDKRSSRIIGTNAKMSEYACAVGLASLDRWSTVKSSYLEIQNRAIEITNRSGFAVHQAMNRRFVNPYWIIRAKTNNSISKISELCKSNGIESRLWWEHGCHKMPAFQKIESEKLKTTDDISLKYLGLPFHLHLNEDYWNTISNILDSSKE